MLPHSSAKPCQAGTAEADPSNDSSAVHSTAGIAECGIFKSLQSQSDILAAKSSSWQCLPGITLGAPLSCLSLENSFSVSVLERHANMHIGMIGSSKASLMSVEAMTAQIQRDDIRGFVHRQHDCQLAGIQR